MNIYQKIGTICLIGATASLALGLLVNPWFLALGAALAGASAALEIVSDSVSSHKVKVIVIDAGEGGLIYEYAKEYRPHCWHSSGRKSKILTMLL